MSENWGFNCWLGIHQKKLAVYFIHANRVFFDYIPRKWKLRFQLWIGNPLKKIRLPLSFGWVGVWMDGISKFSSIFFTFKYVNKHVMKWLSKSYKNFTIFFTRLILAFEFGNGRAIFLILPWVHEISNIWFQTRQKFCESKKFF